MKAQKINKKLNFNKLTISHLSDIHGGEEKVEDTHYTYCKQNSCIICSGYAYTCPGWTRCPDLAC